MGYCVYNFWYTGSFRDCRLVVNVRSGVYYQKCYDPHCRILNYKSPGQSPSPHHISWFFFVQIVINWFKASFSMTLHYHCLFHPSLLCKLLTHHLNGAKYTNYRTTAVALNRFGCLDKCFTVFSKCLVRFPVMCYNLQRYCYYRWASAAEYCQLFGEQ